MKLEDIARKAGVSRSTVSRVINSESYVSEATRRKVLAVIEAEGFSPNPAARILVTQRTDVIGVVIPHPMQEIFSGDEPYYFPNILQGIAEITQQRDYAMLLWIANPREDDARFYERVLMNRLMDGLIILASVTGENMLVERLLSDNTPFVMIGRPLHLEEYTSFVAVDNVQAARQIVHHLISLNRRRIATITGSMENIDGQDRLLGYKIALETAGIPFDSNLVIEGRFNREAGYMCMKQLLNRDVDAVFAASDIVAVGAMQAIHDAGLIVPDDVAVVGFDDLPTALQTKPQLTTVRQPVTQKGAQATSLLLDFVEGIIEGPVQKLLPTQLVIRQSCGADYK